MSKKDLFFQQARDILFAEGTALHNLADTIDHSFSDIIHFIMQCNGKLICTGIGKSAIIARKLSGTLNSIGVSSLFLNASDALHGDLGTVSNEDHMILFSKSGNTTELKSILNILDQRKVMTLGISMNPNSYLAKYCSLHFTLPKVKEIDDDNLIPTTSFTVFSSLANCIAYCLLQTKEGQVNVLSATHPQGMIGKHMTLKIDKIIDVKNKPQVDRKASFQDVLVCMSKHRLGMTVVLNGSHDICGIITDGDIRRNVEKSRDLSSLTAEKMMTTKPIVIQQDLLAIEGLRIMQSKHITQLIVVSDDQKYVGVIHLHDILKEGLS